MKFPVSGHFDGGFKIGFRYIGICYGCDWCNILKFVTVVTAATVTIYLGNGILFYIVAIIKWKSRWCGFVHRCVMLLIECRAIDCVLWQLTIMLFIIVKLAGNLTIYWRLIVEIRVRTIKFLINWRCARLGCTVVRGTVVYIWIFQITFAVTVYHSTWMCCYDFLLSRTQNDARYQDSHAQLVAINFNQKKLTLEICWSEN